MDSSEEILQTPSVTLEQMKKRYGVEYPDAIMVMGIRLPLRNECRFSRSYSSKKYKMGSTISRFMDKSASITLEEIQKEWPMWTETERLDFCNSCSWLSDQADFPDILRHIMSHGGPEDWSPISVSIASQLPHEEAFGFLRNTLTKMEIGRGSNIGQAIALTKHVQADSVLRQHMATIWKYDGLWEDASFLNWPAFEATTTIAHLIEIGAPPEDFDEQARKLAEHPCEGNRNSCIRHLSKYYFLLKPAEG